jgi:membrane protein
MPLFKLEQQSKPPGEILKERASPWRLGGLSAWQLLKRVYQAIDEDEVLTRGAALAYFFVFALFPMIFFLTAVLGFFAQSQALQSSLLHYTSRFMPGEASQLVQKTLQEIAIHSSGAKLALGLVLALWSGAGGVSSIMDALNRCYQVKDARPWWRRRLIAIALTIAMSGLTIFALVIVLYGSDIVAFVGAHTGLSDPAVRTWQIVQWPVALFFVVLSFAFLYYWGPDVKQQWQWITPGSLVGVMVWIGVSLIFRVYLHFFNSYSKTYGSLGAAMVLMLWLYISALAILLGGEINSEIEKAAARRGHPEAKLPREKVA